MLKEDSKLLDEKLDRMVRYIDSGEHKEFAREISETGEFLIIFSKTFKVIYENAKDDRQHTIFSYALLRACENQNFTLVFLLVDYFLYFGIYWQAVIPNEPLLEKNLIDILECNLNKLNEIKDKIAQSDDSVRGAELSKKKDVERLSVLILLQILNLGSYSEKTRLKFIDFLGKINISVGKVVSVASKNEIVKLKQKQDIERILFQIKNRVVYVLEIFRIADQIDAILKKPKDFFKKPKDFFDWIFNLISHFPFDQYSVQHDFNIIIQQKLRVWRDELVAHFNFNVDELIIDQFIYILSCLFNSKGKFYANNILDIAKLKTIIKSSKYDDQQYLSLLTIALSTTKWFKEANSEIKYLGVNSLFSLMADDFVVYQEHQDLFFELGKIHYELQFIAQEDVAADYTEQLQKFMPEVRSVEDICDSCEKRAGSGKNSTGKKSRKTKRPSKRKKAGGKGNETKTRITNGAKTQIKAVENQKIILEQFNSDVSNLTKELTEKELQKIIAKCGRVDKKSNIYKYALQIKIKAEIRLLMLEGSDSEIMVKCDEISQVFKKLGGNLPGKLKKFLDRVKSKQQVKSTTASSSSSHMADFGVFAKKKDSPKEELEKILAKFFNEYPAIRQLAIKNQMILTGSAIYDIYMAQKYGLSLNTFLHDLDFITHTDVSGIKNIGKSQIIKDVLLTGELSGLLIDISQLAEEDSIKAALKQRDFSICSLGYDVKTEKILDYVNGVADIFAGEIRCTNNNPIETFCSDLIRIFRLIKILTKHPEFKLKQDIQDFLKNPIVEENEEIVVVNPSRVYQTLNEHLLRLPGDAFLQNLFNPKFHAWKVFFTLFKSELKLESSEAKINAAQQFLINLTSEDLDGLAQKLKTQKSLNPHAYILYGLQDEMPEEIRYDLKVFDSFIKPILANYKLPHNVIDNNISSDVSSLT